MGQLEDRRAGVRIRERRLDRGIRQADLAALVGISPSYLNLIEHNRRRITDDLLAGIASALEVEPVFLIAGAERAVLDQMRQAAVTFADAAAELSRTEDMAARYPGWAALIAAQTKRLAELERQVQTLTDRMSNDPALATSLHGVISAVTSIRSTAAILTSDEQLDADWRGRFHRNIHDDSERLAAQSEALMAYLETPEEAASLLLSPVEEAEEWLAAIGYHIPDLEDGDDVKAVLDQAKGLRPSAKDVLQYHLARYAQDAALLPLDVLTQAAITHDYDPMAIAQQTARDLALVMRRLACLPGNAGHLPVGLVICDSGGYVSFMRPVPGFAMPRAAACPLWPGFAALGQVGRAIQQDVVLSGTPDIRLRCTAIASHQPHNDYARPPVAQATMLVLPDPAPNAATPIPIGVACRICPRDDCTARREPSALAGGL